MRWIAMAAALCLTVSVGCKKDEPKKDEPSSEQKTDDKDKGTDEAKADEAKTDEPKADGATKEEAADGARTAAPVAVKTPPAADSGAAGTLWGITFPADAVGIGSVASYDTIFDTVVAKAAKYGVPLPITKDLAMEQIKTALGLKSMDWFATDKRIKVLAWNPKDSKEPAVLLIPIKSWDDLVKALPDTAKKDVDGNKVSLSVDGETVFINDVAGYAALTPNKDQFGKAKAFAAVVAKDFEGKGLIDVRVNAGSLRTIYAAEIKGLRGMIDQLKPKLLAEMQKEMPIPGMDLSGIIDMYLSIANTVIDEAQGLGWSTSLSDDGRISITTSLSATAGGKIAGIAKTLEGADLTFTGGAPAASWLLAGGQIDPKSFDGMMKYGMDIVTGMLKLNEEERKTLDANVKTLMDLQDGTSWTALYADGKFPMAIAMAAGISDKKKYMAAFDGYMGMLISKALALAKDQLPPTLQGVPTDDFGKLIAALNLITAQMGVTMETKTADSDGITVSSLVVSADMEKLKTVAGAEAHKKVKEVTDLLGATKIEMALGYGDKRMSMAVGPNAVKAATDAAAGRAGGSTVHKTFEKGTGMYFHVDIATAVKAWLPIVKAAGEDVSKVPDFPAGTSVGVAINGSGNSVGMSFYGSLDEFVSLGMKAFSREADDDRDPFDAPELKEEAAPEKEEAAPEKEEAAPEKEEAAPEKEEAAPEKTEKAAEPAPKAE